MGFGTQSLFDHTLIIAPRPSFFSHICSLVENILPLYAFLTSKDLLLVPPVTSFALPSSAAGALNAPLPPPLIKNPPETSVPAQKTGLAEETHSHAFCDQANRFAANQEVSSFQATAAPEQVLAAVSAEASAAHEECGPPASLGSHVVTAKGHQSDHYSEVEELCTQDIKPVSDDAKSFGEVSDVCTGQEEGKGASPKPSLDGLMNQCGESDEEKTCHDVAHENDIGDKSTPAVLLSKTFQSKGTDKYEGSQFSTHHPSGWFILNENQTHVLFPHLFLHKV